MKKGVRKAHVQVELTQCESSPEQQPKTKPNGKFLNLHIKDKFRKTSNGFNTGTASRSNTRHTQHQPQQQEPRALVEHSVRQHSKEELLRNSVGSRANLRSREMRRSRVKFEHLAKTKESCSPVIVSSKSNSRLAKDKSRSNSKNKIQPKLDSQFYLEL
mmetsp:Transcript_29079/g.63981  ORF Transcript_29079/g.63981 Transcript_29079/m.63981 type:complete len:159 (+) Transcript_29079:1118-1594(+)